MLNKTNEEYKELLQLKLDETDNNIKKLQEVIEAELAQDEKSIFDFSEVLYLSKLCILANQLKEVIEERITEVNKNEISSN